MADVWYAIQCWRSFHIAQKTCVVFLLCFRQPLQYLIFLPKLAYFVFKFKRAIICAEGWIRIGLEFGGHPASHCTRKYLKIASAQYNLYL